jgi:UDP-N-acetyl-D-galactosamine dehydrogenase
MLGINTKSVIEAASTKWNFMKLSPGLVGGHCISVDPYYLISKAQKSGYILDLVRSAREINNSMPQYLANDFLNNLVRRKINPVNLKVVILGFTFKENCPDIRNTKVVNLYQSLVQCGFKVEVFDPVADKKSVLEQYGLTLVEASVVTSRVAILAVGHEEVIGLCENVGFDYIYDFKGVLN